MQTLIVTDGIMGDEIGRVHAETIAHALESAVRDLIGESFPGESVDWSDVARSLKAGIGVRIWGVTRTREDGRRYTPCRDIAVDGSNGVRICR